ncbi:MAG: biopolymer transporter ExbD, partial [Bdellovibrionota bacterium]
VLVVNKSKHISINGNTVAAGTLRSKLEAISSVKPQVQVFVRADQNLPYGYITQVMAEIKKAKIHRVGLVTEPGEQNSTL